MGNSSKGTNLAAINNQNAATTGMYQNYLFNRQQQAAGYDSDANALRSRLMNVYGGNPQPTTWTPSTPATGPGGTTQNTPVVDYGMNGQSGQTGDPSKGPGTSGYGTSGPADTGMGGLNDFTGLTPNSSGWYDLPSDYTQGPSLSAGSQAAGGDFSAAKAGYTDAANTGFASNYDKAQGTFDNLASTGGIDATAIRNQENAIIPSFYSQYKAQSANRANTQGGYSPGFDSQQEEMARQAGIQGFNASRQTEGDIAKLQQQGIEAGGSGQLSIASGETGNKLTGLGGLTNIGGMEQQNNQFNAGLDQSNNQFNANSTNSYSNRNLAATLQLQQQGQSGRQFSASQLQDLHNSDVSQSNNANSNILAGMGGMTAAQSTYLQQMLASNTPIDWAAWARMGAQVATVVATA